MGTHLPPKKGHSPHFSAHVYCGQTVAHLSYCWAFVHTSDCNEIPIKSPLTGAQNAGEVGKMAIFEGDKIGVFDQYLAISLKR